jgi:cytochrome P450
MYYLLRDRTVYAKLREELDAHFTGPEDVDNFQSVQDLPYLSGTVQEALRLGTPFPGLPRVVQKGGCAIDGIFVPEDTIVVCLH